MKLYWRLKIKGKWTWRPAEFRFIEHPGGRDEYRVIPLEEEE